MQIKARKIRNIYHPNSGKPWKKIEMDFVFLDVNCWHMDSEKSPFVSEEEKLKIILNRTHTERFHMLMKLIRINQMLRRAKIIYPEK